MKTSSIDDNWLVGGGEMGCIIRAMDWSKTPLGPIESWSRSLRITVNLALASNFPIDIIWGPERNQIYNDGYWPLCGDLHPHSMGQNFKECWSSAWDALNDAFEQASAGESAFLSNQRIFLNRFGYIEETFFTFSFSPIRDETGEVAGLFHPVVELTQQTLAERRLEVVRGLADHTSDSRTVAEACEGIAGAFGSHQLDVPFALLYLVDAGGDQATLAVGTGLEARSAAAPSCISLATASGGPWPLVEAMRQNTIIEVDDLARRFSEFTCGPYPEPPKTAFVQPINLSGTQGPFAFLVTGVSARRVLDLPYRSFYLTLAGGVTNALANARGYEQERDRAEALVALDRAKTAFLTNVSHEFRTPLTLMLGPLETLMDSPRTDVPPSVMDEVQVVHRNSLRLLRLVNDLLDFSRIEAGRTQVSYEATDLSRLTAELASGFRSATEQAGVRLVVDCRPLPELIHVDRQMWEKIVLNLVSNAFKFTFEGEILVTLKPDGPDAELRVSDTGTGIPPDAIPHLFERFYRVEGAHGRSYEGSGIGLALVHELVQLHGGSVRVESQVGEGTTVIVTLPFGKAHLPPDRINVRGDLASTGTGAAPFVEEALRWLPPAASSDGARRISPTAPRQSRARVLVADDNADMRQYITQLLSPGCDVELVADGEAALAAVKQQRPDLILTDVMMPRMDGFELLRAIRNDPSTETIPVLLLSARAGEESRIEGLDRGADDYLIKPFSARELTARVGAHLEIARIRNEAEQRLRESEERFRSIFEHAPTGIAIRDLTGRILHCNPAYVSMFGYTVEELKRLDSDSLIHPEERAANLDGIRRLIDQNLPAFEVDGRYIRKDGEPVLIHKFVSLLRNTEGDPEQMMELVTDVTARRKAEAALRHADRMEAVGRLAGGVAHEANNQMTVVLGCSRFALAQPDLPAGIEAELHQIRRAATSTAAVTAQLLAFSRRQQVHLQLLDLNETIRGFLPVLGRILEVNGQLSFKPSSAPGFVSADPSLLEQVLVNLTLNARDAMTDGGRLVLETSEVTIPGNEHNTPGAELPPGRYCLISASDSGSGMSQEVLSRIFEPFFTTKPLGRGSGLGLSTVYGITRQLGGNVEVQSSPGEGTRFDIYLPLADREPPAETTTSARPSAPETTPLGGTVLVVEDEPMVRALAVRALEAAGFRVLEASNGKEALDVLETHSGAVDAVVSDVAMPVMGGRELAENLARIDPGLPLLLISGHAPAELVRRGMLASENVPVMQKPFELDELVDRVRALVGTSNTASSQ